MSDRNIPSKEQVYREALEKIIGLSDSGMRDGDEARAIAKRALTDKPSQSSDAALDEFTRYFVKNYPGPDTIIHDPRWHAPKIFRAVLHALSLGVETTPAPLPLGFVLVAQCASCEVKDVPHAQHSWKCAALPGQFVRIQDSGRVWLEPQSE